MVNPRTRILYAAFFAETLKDSPEVYVVEPVHAGKLARQEIAARGYFDFEDDTFAATGCIRVHAPKPAVIEEGTGLGLMLYAGLALGAAHLAADPPIIAEEAGIKTRPCISSPAVPDGRTGKADAFWDRQMKRGLAKLGVFAVYDPSRIKARRLKINTLAARDVILQPWVLDVSESVTKGCGAVPRYPVPEAVQAGVLVKADTAIEVVNFVRGGARPKRILPVPRNPAGWNRIFARYLDGPVEPDPVE